MNAGVCEMELGAVYDFRRSQNAKEETGPTFSGRIVRREPEHLRTISY
jgi:hypothetical protein